MSSQTSVARPRFLHALNQIDQMSIVRTLAARERLSGSEEERAALEYARDYLEDAGFRVQRYSYDALIGYPIKSVLTVLAPEAFTIDCISYSLTPPTESDGVEGQLLPASRAAEITASDASADRYILLHDSMGSAPSSILSDSVRALASIHIDGDPPHQLCISPVRGTARNETAKFLPKTPSVGIGLADGDRLEALLAAGAVQVRLTVECVREWRTIPVLIGDLAGESSEFVLLSSHIDSWYEGAMDNAAGNSAVLAIAKAVSMVRRRPTRGLRVALWSGHSHGRYAGSAAYADDQWDDLEQHCAAHVEIDSIGGKGATVVTNAPSMAETYRFVHEVVLATTGEEIRYNRMPRAGGESAAFWGIGIPSMFGIFSMQEPPQPAGESLGSWWHRPTDTVENVDPNVLRRDIEAHGYAVWELLTRPVLPLQFSETVREIREGLLEYSALRIPRVDLDEGLTICQQLHPLLTAIEDHARNITAPSTESIALSQALLEIGHRLIPANNKEQARTDQDLSIPSGAIPALSALHTLAAMRPSSDEYYLTLAGALRDRNRITSQLREALCSARKITREVLGAAATAESQSAGREPAQAGTERTA